MQMIEYAGVAFIVLLFVTVITMSVMRAKKASQQISETCRRRGWRHTKGQVGFDAVSGTEAGVPWEISVKATNDTDDSHSDSGYARFSFSIPTGKGYAHLIPRPAYQLLTTGVGGALVNRLASKMPGSGMLESITRSPSFEVNGLPDHVGTGDQRLLARLISSESASAIRTWPEANSIAISVTDGQVEIKFSRYEPVKFARDLEQIHALGITLIRASRRP
jgi:hypothetical protein